MNKQKSIRKYKFCILSYIFLHFLLVTPFWPAEGQSQNNHRMSNMFYNTCWISCPHFLATAISCIFSAWNIVNDQTKNWSQVGLNPSLLTLWPYFSAIKLILWNRTDCRTWQHHICILQALVVSHRSVSCDPKIYGTLALLQKATPALLVA